MANNDASVSTLVDEYRTLLNEEPRSDDSQLEPKRDSVACVLHRDADWSPDAAQHIVDLVRLNGSFVLRNALALALALDLVDGDLGL